LDWFYVDIAVISNFRLDFVLIYIAKILGKIFDCVQDLAKTIRQMSATYLPNTPFNTASQLSCLTAFLSNSCTSLPVCLRFTIKVVFKFSPRIYFCTLLRRIVEG